MPIRWRWPPENSCGKRFACSGVRPTTRSSSSTRAARLAATAVVDHERLAEMSPTVMRGLSDAYGSWKTICMSLRTSRICRRDAARDVATVEEIVPAVGAVSRISGARASSCRSRTRRRARASRRRGSRGDAVDGVDVPDGALEDPARIGKCLTSSATRRISLPVSARWWTARGRLGAHATTSARTWTTAAQLVREVTRAVMPAPSTAERRDLVACSARAAKAQRGWKRQPGGRLMNEGGAPAIGSQPLLVPGQPGRLPAARSCRDAAALGRCRRPSPDSTMCPAYITRTRSHISATIPRSCVIRMVAASVSCCTRLSTSRTCAWIVTSSAVVGSSAIRSDGELAIAHRDHRALAHAARELVRILRVARLRIRDPDDVEQLDHLLLHHGILPFGNAS